MGAQFGNTKIGGMQYNGVTIGEAMYNGQVVYRSIVTVTPLPPTFLDIAPWLKLPTQEGVLYAVAGTAGPENTVTVTATAESGYELVGQVEWTHEWLPVVTITGGSSYTSRTQFRQACIGYGTVYSAVETLPFLLDTSQATHLDRMFQGCASLTHVPDLDTSNATDVRSMFQDCAALTDGNVRLIGKHPSVNTSSMIRGSGLTREPFYDQAGNPI